MATKVTTGLLSDNSVTDAKLSATITATTQSDSDNTTKVATTAFVSTAIANLADSAPSTLNTLNELAAALGDDANYATTTTNAIAAKLPLAGGTMTGTLAMGSNAITSTGTISAGAVNSTGEMRITNPSATSQLYLYGASGQKANIILNEYGVRAWHVGAGTFTSGKFSISDGTTERLNIDASGNVGIGTSSPSAKLSLGAASGAKRFLVYDSGGSTNLYAGFGIDAPGANDFSMYSASSGNLAFGKMASDGSTITKHMSINNSSDVDMHGTGSLKIPNGTTAQRPSSPATGMIRYNTTLAVIEEYRGSAWETLSDFFSATGGTKTTSGSYTYHTFTSSGSISFSGSKAIDILIVAGGAGGGINSNTRAAGGGAGGLIFISSYPAQATSYTVSVGSGGAEGASGTNSVFSFSGGTTLTALGGGMGGYNDSTDNGADGGSGGGQWYPGYAGASATQPANTNDGSNTYNSTGFGNDGGTSGATQPYGSGGGGAGAVGANFNSATPGVGGVGKNMSATFGTSVGESGWFAGGGGTGSYPPQGDVKYVGGTGGGGRGWNNGTETAQNGTANTGGGGGAGGSGGSGIVILRYTT